VKSESKSIEHIRRLLPYHSTMGRQSPSRPSILARQHAQDPEKKRNFLVHRSWELDVEAQLDDIDPDPLLPGSVDRAL
jgi:hypothetical protein